MRMWSGRKGFLAETAETGLLAGFCAVVDSYGRAAQASGDLSKAANDRLIGLQKLLSDLREVANTDATADGLRRIRPEEAPGMGEAARAGIRSKARRASRGIKSVIGASNGVDPDTQRRASAEISALGLLAEVAGNSAQPCFEAGDTPMAPAVAGSKFLQHIGAEPDLFDREGRS